MPEQKLKTKKRKKYIRKETKSDGKLRVPRPLGFTYTSIILNNHKNNKEEYNNLLNQLKQRTIEIWINNDMQLNGKQVKVTEIAQYLNLRTNQVLVMMNKEIERISNFFDGPDGKRIARVSFFQGLKKSSEIMAQVQNQANILMCQQGTEYVPFLTGEVNRSLTNLINAQKPMQDLLKMLMEKHTTNIILPVDGTSSNGGQHYLSPEQALEMLNNDPSLLNNPAAIEAKEKELGLLPDVLARNQDLSKIGVRIPAKLISPYIRENATNIHNNRPDRVPNDIPNADEFNA